MTPHDEDMVQLVDRLRERLENWATETVKQAGEIGDLKRWLAEVEAERDALEVAVADVRRLCNLTIAASCRVQAIEQAVDTLAVLDRTLASRETSGEAGRIADERPAGIHAFQQNPAAMQISVCICGKWRDHHIHGANPCSCDECRTSAIDEAET